MFSTDEYEAKMTGAFEHFGEELRKIRTGRAHPTLQLPRRKCCW